MVVGRALRDRPHSEPGTAGRSGRDRLEFWEYEDLAQSIAGLHGYMITRWGHLAVAFGDGNLYSFLAATVYYTAGHQPMVLAVTQAIIASLAVPGHLRYRRARV